MICRLFLPTYLDGAILSALSINSSEHHSVTPTSHEPHNVEITTESVDLFSVHIVASSLILKRSYIRSS